MAQNKVIGTLNGIQFVVAPVVAPQPKAPCGHPKCMGCRSLDLRICVDHTGETPDYEWTGQDAVGAEHGEWKGG